MLVHPGCAQENVPCIAFTGLSDVTLSFPMVSSFTFSDFFLTLFLLHLMAK